MVELREMDCSVLRHLLHRGDCSGGSYNQAGGGTTISSSSSPPAGGKCLLLDCRPFLAHSAGYIRGALNVRCNTIVRRRTKGSISLEQILPAEDEVRSRLLSGLYSAVVVYDERSLRAESLREDSTLSLVVRTLRKDTEHTNICLLKGRRGGEGRTNLAGEYIRRLDCGS